jgi:CRP/FNR family cyclic AMP-dependent transcriptional regulator
MDTPPGRSNHKEAQMNAQSFTPLLQRHPFSKDFEPRQIEHLAALARAVRFEPEQVIFRSGEECADFFLIVDGRVALEMPVRGGVLPIQTLSDGDEFGFSVLIRGRPMTFQARTLGPVETLAIDGRRLLEACEQDPRLGFNLMRQMLLIVSERLDATRLQLMDNWSPVAARAGA